MYWRAKDEHPGFFKLLTATAGVTVGRLVPPAAAWRFRRCAGLSGFGAETQRQELPAEYHMDQADDSEDSSGFQHLGFACQQDIADEHPFEFFVSFRAGTQHQKARGGGHDVDDADQRFVRHPAMVEFPHQGEQEGAGQGEGQGKKINAAAFGFEPHDQARRGAERGDLGEGKIYEDDLPFDDVQPVIDENRRLQQTGDDRPFHDRPD